MSLLGKFTKRSNLDPIKRLAEDAVSDAARSLERKFENSIEDLFSKNLSNGGLSSRITRELSSKFSDAVRNKLADKYFQTLSTEINRVTQADICDSFLPSYADTASASVRYVEEDLKNIEGVSNHNILQYPRNLGKYYMSMKFRQYVRQAPQVQTTYKFDNAILLPVPRKLGEEFNMQVSTQALGLVGGAADIIQTTSSGAGEDYSPTQAFVFAAMTQAVGALASGASQYGGGNISDALYSYIGSVPNPHFAALFNGVDLRKFDFEWTFSPRNAEESIIIQEIVEKLKQNSLPAFSTLGTPVLQYPLMCQIELEPWNGDGADLIRFKPALLESVKVNYSPNGIPSFFAGTNLPSFIQISLSFVETTYFTSNDFGRAGSKDNKLEQLVSSSNDFLSGILPEGFSDGFSKAVEDFDGIIRGTSD